MSDSKEKPAVAVKAKQANIRLTSEQERLLKIYCVRTGMTTQSAIIYALAQMIEGFEA